MTRLAARLTAGLAVTLLTGITYAAPANADQSARATSTSRTQSVKCFNMGKLVGALLKLKNQKPPPTVEQLKEMVTSKENLKLQELAPAIKKAFESDKPLANADLTKYAAEVLGKLSVICPDVTSLAKMIKP